MNTPMPRNISNGDADNIIGIHMKLEGEYKIVLNEGTEREFNTDWMDNLVLDQGLNYIGSSSTNLFAFASVGTGTTTPANSQTALTTFLASQALTSESTTNLGSTTYAGQYTSVYTYAQGAVVGNIAELGVGRLTGGANLFSRTLIVDNSGVPTTITVTSLDQLTVYYRLTNIPSLSDITGSVTLAAVSYGYTARLSDATNFFNLTTSFSLWRGATPYSTNVGSGNAVSYPSGCTIGAITSNPSGTATLMGAMTYALSTYTAGNFYQDVTITIPPSTGNSAGGIGGLFIPFGVYGSGGTGSWQYVFSPAIPKDNTKTLTLVIRYTWGR